MKLQGKLQSQKSLDGFLSRQQKASGQLSIPSSLHNLDYKMLLNKPQIEGVELVENKTFEDLGLNPITGEDLVDMFNDLWR